MAKFYNSNFCEVRVHLIPHLEYECVDCGKAMKTENDHKEVYAHSCLDSAKFELRRAEYFKFSKHDPPKNDIFGMVTVKNDIYRMVNATRSFAYTILDSLFVGEQQCKQ